MVTWYHLSAAGICTFFHMNSAVAFVVILNVFLLVFIVGTFTLLQIPSARIKKRT